MEFFNIQILLETSINFSQYDFKNMSEDEKEMLVSNLSSKITKKNQYFDRMISKQEELSDKHILLHIQYLLANDFDSEDIKRIIKRTKEQYEMVQEQYLADIEAELLEAINMPELEEQMEALNLNEKEELEIDQKINKFFLDKTIEGVEHKEDTVTYVGDFTPEEMVKLIEIFRMSLKNKYSLFGFCERLSKPFLIENFVSKDLIRCLIEKIVKSENMTESLQQYILQEIINFMTHEEDED